MGESAWYERFFDEHYLRSYAAILVRFDAEAEADLVLEQLCLEPGMRLLDLCCGQGRHAVALARRGIRVTGLDLSAYLLGVAREAAAAAAVDVELHRGDMREIPWSSTFDAAICMLSAFGYFEGDEENLRVLEGVARALVPGGRFCLDVISASWLLRHWESTGWTEGKGGLLRLEERSMDWIRGIQTSEHTFIEPDGRRWKRTARLRLYLPHELAGLLRRAGLETVKLLGDHRAAPFDLESPRLIAIARKPGEPPGATPSPASSSA